VDKEIKEKKKYSPYEMKMEKKVKNLFDHGNKRA